MTAEVDWDKRAYELLPTNPATRAAALKLGREMEVYARRAEATDCAKIIGDKEALWRRRREEAIPLVKDMIEIAKLHGVNLVELHVPSWLKRRIDVEAHKARQAGSAFTEQMLPVTTLHGVKLKIAEDAADARAEEIENACMAENCKERGIAYSDGLCRAADLARSTIKNPEPMTREQALEEALRSIAMAYGDSAWVQDIAGRALELKR